MELSKPKREIEAEISEQGGFAKAQKAKPMADLKALFGIQDDGLKKAVNELRLGAKKMKKIIAFTGSHGTGKTTSALQETINQKIYHPEKSVHCLVDLEAFCPFPINQKTIEESQAWLFANHLQQLLETRQKYDIVILDRTLVDVIAYTKVAGFTEQAESMLDFLKFHINFYTEIRVKKIKDNDFCLPDGIRETKDLKFRQDVEDCLLDLYYEIKKSHCFIDVIFGL